MRWRRQRKTIALTILVLLYLVGDPITGEGDSFTPRPPIEIDGNESFTTENGVVSGQGTVNDPFVISGWAIKGSEPILISISNTDQHVVIENNLLIVAFNVIELGYSAAIQLKKTQNVTIKGNKIDGVHNGFTIYDSHRFNVTGNKVRGAQAPGLDTVVTTSIAGLSASNSSEGVISNNHVSWSGWGINVQEGSSNISVVENVVEDFGIGQGVGVSKVRNLQITRNMIAGGGSSSVGVFADESVHVTIANNSVSDVNRGVSVIKGVSFDVEDNIVEGARYSVSLSGCTECKVNYNKFTRIREGFSVSAGVRVEFNLFTESDYGLGPATHTGLYRNNSFRNSIDIYAQVHSGELDVSYNWWDSTSGPDPSKFELGGQAGVIYRPFLMEAPMYAGPRQ